MSAMLYILPAILPLFALIAGARVCLRLEIRSRYMSGVIGVRLFFGIINYTLPVMLTYLPPRLFINGKKRKLTPQRRKKKRPGTVNAVIKGLTPERIVISGEIGIKDDNARAVMLCGALNTLLKTLVLPLNAEDAFVDIHPRMGHSCFCIILEGIVKVEAAKIILTTIKRKLIKNLEEKKYRDTSC